MGGDYLLEMTQRIEPCTSANEERESNNEFRCAELESRKAHGGARGDIVVVVVEVVAKRERRPTFAREKELPLWEIPFERDGM